MGVSPCTTMVWSVRKYTQGFTSVTNLSKWLSDFALRISFRLYASVEVIETAMFGKKKLTEEEVLELKALAKGIKIEYVENQINPG